MHQIPPLMAVWCRQTPLKSRYRNCRNGRERDATKVARI